MDPRRVQRQDPTQWTLSNSRFQEMPISGTIVSGGGKCSGRCWAMVYVVEYELSLPLSVFNFRGQTISVAVYFDFGGSSSTTQCTTSITLTEASRYGMVAGAVLMLGIGGILTGVRRRRKVATIQLSEEEGTMSHFEMMPNEAVARV